MKIRSLLAAGLSIIILSALSSGCAMAPLSNPTSARSLGKGGFTTELSTFNSDPLGFRLAYGISENFDLGIEWEVVAAGLSAKYSLLNQPEGTAFALLGGTGSSVGGSYTYGGIIGSQKIGIIEPFALLRFNYVKFEQLDLDFGEFFGSHTIEAGSYTYFNLAAGATLWPANWFGLNLALNALSSGSPGDARSYVTGNLLFRF